MEDTVSLTNLGGGAAVEMFDNELSLVLDNIQDPNTEAKKVRKITLEVSIKPDDNRSFGEVMIQAKSAIAPSSPFPTKFFIGKTQNGKAVACEHNPAQLNLFPQEQNSQENVLNIHERKEKNAQ